MNFKARKEYFRLVAIFVLLLQFISIRMYFGDPITNMNWGADFLAGELPRIYWLDKISTPRRFILLLYRFLLFTAPLWLSLIGCFIMKRKINFKSFFLNNLHWFTFVLVVFFAGLLFSAYLIKPLAVLIIPTLVFVLNKEKLLGQSSNN